MSNQYKLKSSIGASSIDKKIESIYSELEIIKPDTLILNVDPNIESRGLIEHIQDYYNLILKEMRNLKHLEAVEIENTNKMKEKKEELEELIRPHPINYLSKNVQKKQNQKNPNEVSNKPVIDYKSKIRILEKELSHFNQNYNWTKSNNEGLMVELQELRKKTLNAKKKVKEMNEELTFNENEFNENKEEIKNKIESKEDNLIFIDIEKGEKDLKENTNLMIQELKSNDIDIARKLAKQKYYDHEYKKLVIKNNKIQDKWEMERIKFFEQKNEEIKKQNLFDPKSKLLDNIDKEKISKLEEILIKFYDETNLNDIESLVDFFIKCSGEFKNFEEFISNLNINLEKLEKEVDEFEYIINFCQKNLEIKTEDLPDEEYNNQLALYRKSAEAVIHMQYYAMNDLYKNFCVQISESLAIFFEDHSEENVVGIDDVNFQDSVKIMLEKIQDRIKSIFRKMKESYSSHIEDNIKFDFSEVNNLYSWKNEKIKDAVKKEFEKINDKGLKGLSIDKMKALLNPILHQEKLK